MEAKDINDLDCWVGIFKPEGELVRKITSEKPVFHYSEVIDPRSLEPGVYHIVIQQKELILVDKIEI